MRSLDCILGLEISSHFIIFISRRRICFRRVALGTIIGHVAIHIEAYSTRLGASMATPSKPEDLRRGIYEPAFFGVRHKGRLRMVERS